MTRPMWKDDLGPASVLNFGAYRGFKLKDCPLDYLRWMARELAAGDRAAWAIAAQQYLAGPEARRRAETEQGETDLEAQANQLLRRAGYKSLAKGIPKKYQPRSRP